MHATRLLVFGAVFCCALLTGVLGFAAVEGLTFLDALYLTVITMSTVGYGDFTPATSTGKVLAMVVIVGGVGSFVGLIEAVAENVFSLKEKKAKQQKRNMIRGVFYADLGQALLKEIAAADPNAHLLGEKLAINAEWDQDKFLKKKKFLNEIQFALNPDSLDLARIRDMLAPKADLLLRLIENPSVVEAEAFGDLLQAMYHLRDELMSRPKDLGSLPQSDRRHLAGDVERVYALLARQWLSYVRYLQKRYAYLYSIAIRKNPFNPSASVVVQS